MDIFFFYVTVHYDDLNDSGNYSKSNTSRSSYSDISDDSADDENTDGEFDDDINSANEDSGTSDANTENSRNSSALSGDSADDKNPDGEIDDDIDSANEDADTSAAHTENGRNSSVLSADSADDKNADGQIDDDIDCANEEFDFGINFSNQDADTSAAHTENSRDCHQLVLDSNEESIVIVDQGLANQLKPHQRNGIQFMWNHCMTGDVGSGCILAHCMGLGKSMQVVAFIHTVFSNCTHIRKVLIISPRNVTSNWMNEFDKWLKYCGKNKDLLKYNFR